MFHTQRLQISLGLLLGVTCLGILLYVSGLASTLRLGNASIRGVLLIPSLPTSLYVIMALVVMAGVGLTLLASFVRRRRLPPESQKQRQPEPIKPPWQVLVSMLTSGTLLFLGVLWLLRHGARLRQWWEHWSHEVGATSDLLATGTQSLLRQVDSPVAGYMLFVTILVVYGGLALLALWVLSEGRERAFSWPERETLQTQRVRRAVTAGLQELQQHTDPRQAIIACYAHMEHFLEDYGVPAYRHLTPQEYMRTALQGLDLPVDALGGLIELFEQARYSLHPLDDTTRESAMTHLKTLKAHLEWETALATHV
jgi:hypothetical protein